MKPLSTRDQAVLAGIARGLTRRKIGHHLGITERHVQTRQRALGQQLGLTHYDQPLIVQQAYQRGLMAYLAPEPRAPVFLPQRQRQILALLGDGLTNAEIGHRLGIVEDTVKTHVQHLFTAIGARTRAHAVALDHQHRFRDTDHQLEVYRAQYPGRAVFRGARLVHAWDGRRTPCSGAERTVAELPGPRAPVTCERCRTALGLLQQPHHTAA